MRIRGFNVLAMERIEEGLTIFGLKVGMALLGWSAGVKLYGAADA
jgi:hypothetical protein